MRTALTLELAALMPGSPVLVTGPLPRQRAEPGGTMLVVGEWQAVDRLNRRSRNCVLLELPTEVEETALAGSRFGVARASLLGVVALMVSGVGIASSPSRAESIH
ncbi:MAG: hypothetical protein IT193_04590 [Propionibacteriaceae bacterium]|nr:hypothetical protein [Propionibacteriaceae bacterium]